METIKLTKEQSEVLEKMRSCHHLRNDKEALLVKHATGWMNAYQELNKIPILAFAQLVLNDFAYEIEPEQPKFKVGDYIFHERTGLVTELTEQKADFVNLDYIEKDKLRLATSEEVYWLAELGREKVGEFREGDVIFTIYDSVFKVVNSEFGSDDFVSVTNAKALKPVGIYPAESFKPFPKELE